MQRNEETLQGGEHCIAYSLKKILFYRNILIATGHEILGWRKRGVLDYSRRPNAHLEASSVTPIIAGL